ncbi:MAG: SPFH domain-containing protein [Helicobacteraceae bacterium]|jgi:regulator of protease activity HflC (stomatin/prohibitin superfamily)|nr:SPFH domain-containing protein [Helicobacteraceae bacterium]
MDLSAINWTVVAACALGLLFALWALKKFLWSMVRFARFEPNSYVFRYRGAKIAAEGAGLSFFYFAPTTSLLVVPIGSEDAPFMLSEISSDFQELTLQGQITYRVCDPSKAVKMLNYAIDNSRLTHISDDPQKLPERLINLALVVLKGAVQRMRLKDALVSADELARKATEALAKHEMVKTLGVEILALSIAAIKPTPETAKALEAETREEILKESDQAIFLRRNYAIEQERIIRESELNTEIAVESKNREIRETRMETERLAMKKEHEMAEERLAFQARQEEKKQELVDLTSRNAKAQADAKAYALKAVMDVYERTNPEALKALTYAGLDSGRLLAHAFLGIAEQADKIGNLNITPDLLDSIMKNGLTKPAKN